MSAHPGGGRGSRGTRAIGRWWPVGAQLRATRASVCVRAPASVTPCAWGPLVQEKDRGWRAISETSGWKEFWGRGGGACPPPAPASGLVGLHQSLPRRMGRCAAPQPPLLSPERPLPTATAPNKGPTREGGRRCPSCHWIWTPRGPPLDGFPQRRGNGGRGWPSS